MGVFSNDLQAGKQFEQLIYNRYTAIGLKCEFNMGQSLEEMQEYDLTIVINDKVIKVECKLDRLATTTGNVAVELECVKYSKADLFCYMIDNKIYWITRDDLLLIYKKKKYRRITCSRENVALLYLVPLEVFQEYCKVIVEVDSTYKT